MIVVSDTSPLNYLILIGEADVLPLLFQRVIAPPAVIAEMQHSRAPATVAAWAMSPPNWLEVIAPSIVDSSLQLDLGESEAIALMQEFHADSLLVDDRKATKLARKLGLSITSTLTVLAAAAEKNLLDLPAAIAALRKTSFRGPEDLIEQMLQDDEDRRTQRGGQ